MKNSIKRENYSAISKFSGVNKKLLLLLLQHSCCYTKLPVVEVSGRATRHFSWLSAASAACASAAAVAFGNAACVQLLPLRADSMHSLLSWMVAMSHNRSKVSGRHSIKGRVYKYLPLHPLQRKRH